MKRSTRCGIGLLLMSMQHAEWWRCTGSSRLNSSTPAGMPVQLIDEEFESATERNVTTAFRKLAKLAVDADESQKQKITSGRSFQTLVGGSVQCMGVLLSCCCTLL